MRIITVANHKGGVGKTATVHALGEALASMGRRVLLVDCDPQASLSAACGVADAAGRSMAEVIDGADQGTLSIAAIVRDLGAGLAIAPGDIALATCELGLVARMGRENVLKRALASVAGAFDVCLVDTPPSLGLLTVNALTAADGLLVPTVPEIQALRGLTLFWQSLAKVKAALNPDLDIIGVVPTFLDARLVHHRDAMEALHAGGFPVLDVAIGRSVRVAEAAAIAQSVVTYEPSNPRAAEYGALAERINAWLDRERA